MISKRWTKNKSESPTGFEPMTSQTPGGRSIHLSYGELMESEAINYLILQIGLLQVSDENGL